MLEHGTTRSARLGWRSLRSRHPSRSAVPRALSNELGVAGPRLVWSSARLAARIFMQRRRAGERPL